MEVKQAVSDVSAECAAATASQKAADKARDKLEKAAADKAFQDVCGPAPDVACKEQFDVIQDIVSRAFKGATAQLPQMLKATPWQPLLPRRHRPQMADRSGAIAKTSSRSVRWQTCVNPNSRKDPRHAPVRRALTCKPTARMRQNSMYSLYSKLSSLLLRPSVSSPPMNTVPPAQSV